MKATLIAFSLVANLFLAGLLLFPESRAATAGLFRRDDPGPAAPASRRASEKAGPAGDAARTASVQWDALKAVGDREFVEQAKAAGMAPQLIRALLQARFTDTLTARRRELIGPPVLPPYWRIQTGPQPAPPGALAEIRQMSNEFTRQLNELLGPDISPQAEFNERVQFGTLPSDKVAALRSINADYNEMMSATRQNGIILPSDRAKLMFLDEQKDADIRALLTPAEYEEFQFRTSNTANSMRNNLTYFEPTEAEFRAIFALQHAFDKKYNTSLGVPMTLEMSRQRSTDQQQLVQDIKGVLDPSRVADYERTTDGSYRTAMQLVQQLQLPQQAGVAVWQAQKDVQARVNALRMDRSLGVPERNERLAALQAEAIATVGAALGGSRGLEAYKQMGGGWLNSIVPPAPMPPVRTGP